MVTKYNHKQDMERLAMKKDIGWLKKNFERFLTNEFYHLCKKVDWVIGTIVIGFLISITLLLISIAI